MAEVVAMVPGNPVVMAAGTRYYDLCTLVAMYPLGLKRYGACADFRECWVEREWMWVVHCIAWVVLKE